ncbi:MAG: hypothetical protein Ta2E_10030 [Mycoplasmoidaceae bacterium]|nr:MAG: hypothetical protein Ta2E_10030 [Mycoplasmoidaceae bacterium]
MFGWMCAAIPRNLEERCYHLEAAWGEGKTANESTGLEIRTRKKSFNLSFFDRGQFKIQIKNIQTPKLKKEPDKRKKWVELIVVTEIIMSHKYFVSRSKNVFSIRRK